MSRKWVLAALATGLCHAGLAAGDGVTVFQNVRIFDGKSSALSGPKNVLVRGDHIERISAEPIQVDGSATTLLVDGSGRTLMPGLIDMHWHTMLVRPTPVQLLTGDVGHLNLAAGAEATATLMRGFTTVRDMGGPSFGLKRAVDEGIMAGRASTPRVPSSPSPAATATSASRSNCRARSAARSPAASRPEPP